MPFLAAVTLLLLQATPTVPLQRVDELYLRVPDDPGVSERQVGKVVEIDKRFIIFEVDGKRLLATPEAVTHVEISPALHAPKEYAALVESSKAWSSAGTTVLSSFVARMAGDELGRSIGRLDERDQALIMVLLLAGVFAFVGHRAHEWVVVRRANQQLERARAELELIRLRQETLALTLPSTPEHRRVQTIGVDIADTWFAERDALQLASESTASAMVFSVEQRGRRRAVYRAAELTKFRVGDFGPWMLRLLLFGLLVPPCFLLLTLGMVAPLVLILEFDTETVIPAVILMAMGIPAWFGLRASAARVSDLCAAMHALWRERAPRAAQPAVVQS